MLENELQPRAPRLKFDCQCNPMTLSGRVTASSKGEGQGSEFVVRLPTLRHAVPPIPEPRKTPPVAGRRILIVDDNAAAAKMLSIVLSKNADHEIKIVYDGQSALDAAASFRPDIVLLDIGLPRMNGYEVARRLRDQPQFDNTVLVALTGYGTDEDRRRSLEAGFDVHMVKPPSLEKLQQVLAYPKR